MTTPDQSRPDEHGRSGSGVRGAINDLLGRGDRTDDDRRIEEQDRSASGHDGGTAEPADDGYGTGRGSSDATVGAAAPQGERFDDQTGETIPGEARQRDVGPDGPGYDRQDLGDPQPGGPAQAQRQDMGQGQSAQPSADHLRDDRESAGARTDDIVGSGAEATTTPATPAGSAQDRGGSGRNGSGLNGKDVDDRDRAQDVRAGSAAPSGTSVAETSKGEDADGRERLVSADRAESYGSRWDKVKGEFVDEPRQAVADADALVGELLDELQKLFTEQRHGIERNIDADESSTEDMRLALRRYRSFFDRLLSI